MKLIIASISIGAALSPGLAGAESAQRIFKSADGAEYSSICTPEAFFFRNQTTWQGMTVENTCHVQAADGRAGSLCWSNGGFVVNLGDEDVRFPRQEISCDGDIDMSWPGGGDGYDSCRCSAVSYESGATEQFDGYCTPQAYIMRSNFGSDVLTLDTSCTASLGDGREGSWCHENGGIFAEIGEGSFGFPGQSLQCNGATEVEWVGGALTSDQCGC